MHFAYNTSHGTPLSACTGARVSRATTSRLLLIHAAAELKALVLSYVHVLSDRRVACTAANLQVLDGGIICIEQHNQGACILAGGEVQQFATKLNARTQEKLKMVNNTSTLYAGPGCRTKMNLTIDTLIIDTHLTNATHHTQ